MHQSHLLVKGGDENADNDDFPAFKVLFRVSWFFMIKKATNQVPIRCNRNQHFQFICTLFLYSVVFIVCRFFHGSAESACFEA